MLPCSRPGQLYAIDIESVNAGIPYADSFSVWVHYCIEKVADKESQLVVYAQIKYRKSVWGLVKSTQQPNTRHNNLNNPFVIILGLIEKNCWSGLEEFFNSLAKSLHLECEEIIHPVVKRKARRRRKGFNIYTYTFVSAIYNGNVFFSAQHTSGRTKISPFRHPFGHFEFNTTAALRVRNLDGFRGSSPLSYSKCSAILQAVDLGRGAALHALRFARFKVSIRELSASTRCNWWNVFKGTAKVARGMVKTTSTARNAAFCRNAKMAKGA